MTNTTACNVEQATSIAIQRPMMSPALQYSVPCHQGTGLLSKWPQLLYRDQWCHLLCSTQSPVIKGLHCWAGDLNCYKETNDVTCSAVLSPLSSRDCTEQVTSIAIQRPMMSPALQYSVPCHQGTALLSRWPPLLQRDQRCHLLCITQSSVIKDCTVEQVTSVAIQRPMTPSALQYSVVH